MLVFEKGGPANTVKTCELALEEAIRHDTQMVIATTSGGAALAALEACQKRGETGRLVVVSHAFGTRERGVNALKDEARAALNAAGVPIVTAAHALSGAERGLSSVMKGIYPAEIIAHALRMLSQGVKVCVEIGAMALDAGIIPYAKPVVIVGGSGSGADTAVLATPAYSQAILEARVYEVYCKPY